MAGGEVTTWGRAKLVTRFSPTASSTAANTSGDWLDPYLLETGSHRIDGKVIQTGTFAELSGAPGVFADFARRQLL